MDQSPKKNRKWIALGRSQYYWEVQQHTMLKAHQLQVTATHDNDKNLHADIYYENRSDKITPAQIQHIIEYALDNGWSGATKTMRLHIQRDKIMRVASSILEEECFVDILAKRMRIKTPLLEWAPRMEQLKKLERLMDVRLPSAFKLLYLYLGDGGFGPDYGFFPLLERGDKEESILDASPKFRAARSRPHESWPYSRQWISFLHWGCGIYSILDCQTPNGMVRVFDPNLFDEKDWSNCFWVHTSSFMEWLRIWLDSGDILGQGIWLDMYRKKGLV